LEYFIFVIREMLTDVRPTTLLLGVVQLITMDNVIANEYVIEL